jgi:hypothetical protein
MAPELLNLTEMATLDVSTERARKIANEDPTFPAPATGKPRRWSRAKVERWASGTGGTRGRGGSAAVGNPASETILRVRPN